MTRPRQYFTTFLCLILLGMLGLTTSSLAQTQKATDEAALASVSDGVETTSSSEAPRRRVQAARRELAVSIDGRLDEAACSKRR